MVKRKREKASRQCACSAGRVGEVWSRPVPSRPETKRNETRNSVRRRESRDESERGAGEEETRRQSPEEMSTLGGERPHEPQGLSPRASAVALAAVAICLAILWPKLISPQNDVRPNTLDRQTGCCDVFVDTDVNAIKVMAELCGGILARRGGPIDPKTERAFASGKLTDDIVSMCRREVNTTCGIDIAAFLDQNVRLGKSYRQILDEIRSYNGSSCLKRHYGVAPWSIGVPHLVGKFWMEGSLGMRQERPPLVRPAPVHPALRERGRAIVSPGAPSSVPLPSSSSSSSSSSSPSPSGPYQASAPFVQRGPAEGRVRSSPLNVYYVKEDDEPMPIGGIRPPMGGAGGVVPPPKSSVGFVMPLYTLCIVIFFLYTVFKMIFRRQISPDGTQPDPQFKSDPEFRRRVFNEPNRSNRTSPDNNKLVVNAISGLVAEVRQQMEEYHQVNGNATQDGTTRPHTNGSLHQNQRESSPIIAQTKDFALKKESTPPSWEDSTPLREKQPEFSPPKDYVQPSNGVLRTESNISLESKTTETIDNKKIDDTLEEKLNEKQSEDDIVRQVRSSVEKEKATVKPPVEVSSIYLEGALPQQSRLLVADSETHTEEIDDGDEKDAPIVLSGKMTLSVINDELIKAATLEKNTDDINDGEDEDFTTASAATAPKQADGELEESEEEIEEEEEVEEEEIEIEIEEEVEVDTKKESQKEKDLKTAPLSQDKIKCEIQNKSDVRSLPIHQDKVEYEEVEVETDEEEEEEEEEEGTDEEADEIIKIEKANDRT